MRRVTLGRVAYEARHTKSLPAGRRAPTSGRAVVVFALLTALLIAFLAPAAPARADAPLDAPAAEQQLADMINELRRASGQPPLELDPALTELARTRSQDMAERHYFSHDIPGTGYAPLWLMNQLEGARGAGENLGQSNEANDHVVSGLFGAWVASPSHLENMLRPQFTRVGVGVVEVPEGSGRSLKLVTQVFAAAPPGQLRRVAGEGGRGEDGRGEDDAETRWRHRPRGQAQPCAPRPGADSAAWTRISSPASYPASPSSRGHPRVGERCYRRHAPGPGCGSGGSSESSQIVEQSHEGARQTVVPDRHPGCSSGR